LDDASVTRGFTSRAVLAALLSFGTASFAEDVFVKYQGPVRLDSFQCTATASSFVHRICYRPDAQYLVVLLDRTYYHYCRIPKAVVGAWLGAESKGRFYNSSVKGQYGCRQGGIPGAK
jgi:hypothetical protein